MKTLVALILITMILGASPASLSAEEPSPAPLSLGWSLYVNGVKSSANALQMGNQDWFEVEQLSSALGFRAQVSPQGVYVNGQHLQPVLNSGSEKFTTAEAMAKALGATVQKDPVRQALYFQLSNNSAGIPYFSADYLTQEEEYRRQRRAELAMSPGEVVLEEWDEQMEAQWKARHPHTTYQPRAADYRELPYDSTREMPRLLSAEEVRGNSTYRSPKTHNSPSGYLNRSADNGTFRITILDAKLAEALKGLKPPLLPQSGHKFLVIRLTLANVSKSPQRSTWFNVRDQNGSAYPASPLYSQFSRGDLQVQETTSGFLIFEIPLAAQPVALEALVQPALSLSLLYR